MTRFADRALPPWPSVPLDEVAIRGSGHTPSKRHREYWDGPSQIKWVSLADTARLDNGSITETEHTITKAGLANSAAVLRTAGTVILLRGSSVGKSAVLGSEMAVSQDYVTWTCGPMLDAWYLYYYLQSRKAEFARVAFGNTIKTIGLDYFKYLTIALPEISEQRRISEALKDADRSIACVQALILKKQAIKQGMMAQLLTGEVRLAGFRDTWKSRPMSDLIDGLEAGVSVRSTAGQRPGPAILKTSGIDRGRLVPSEAKPIRDVDLTRARLNPVADSIIISRMNTPALVGDVGYVAETHPELYLPDRLWLARRRSGTATDMRWLTYFLASETGARLLRGLATGTSGSMKNIPKNRLLRLELMVPSESEQHRISTVLAGTDVEIDILTRQLSKVRAIRQGMLQRLLTGRTRLVTLEGSA